MKIFAVFLNFVYLKNTVALINVARGATGWYCWSIALPEILFDGETSKGLYTAFRSSCSSNAYIEIKTVAHYFVHYFVIYRGEGNNAEEIWMVYRGCFSSFHGSPATANNIKACAKTCMATHSYFAMKTTECKCGTAPLMENSITITNCGINCNVPNLKCGGEASYSVYLVNFRLPYYDGCYERTDIRSNPPAIEGDMSPGKCLQHCESQKLAWISKGNKCQCSSDRGNSVSKRESCTSPCTGDATFMCGSHSDNMFSVWRGCIFADTHSVKCSDGLMCDGWYNGFGICKGRCKSGFEDPYCLSASNQSAVITTANINTGRTINTEETINTEALPPDPDAPSDQGETSETDETPDPDATPDPAPGDPIPPKEDKSVVTFAAIGGIVLVLGLIIGFVVLRLCKKKVPSVPSSVPASDTASAAGLT